MKKVLWIKIGWSQYYRGDSMDGNFHWPERNEGFGEALNFMPINGTYYINTIPQNKSHMPWNDSNAGWTVICLSKRPNKTGIHVVGWYENATLHGAWLTRPVPPNSALEDGLAGDYTISSRSAYLVPPDGRGRPFSHASVRQGRYSFLTGPGVKTTPRKKELLSILEAEIRDLKDIAVHDPSEKRLPDPQLNAADPLANFGTAEHRKKVEQAAEAAVLAHYQDRGFSSTRVAHLPCGYDFTFSDGETELHVEVKGTAADTPRFFITRNEYQIGMQSKSNWRLAMVMSALSNAPRIAIYDKSELKRSFDLEPYVYLGTFAPEVES